MKFYSGSGFRFGLNLGLSFGLTSGLMALMLNCNAMSYAQSVDTISAMPQLKKSIEEKDAPWYGHPRFTGGLKSLNSSGRFSQMGSQFKSKEELFLGTRNEFGWGVYVNIAYNYSDKSSGASNGPQGPNTQGPTNLSAQKHKGTRHANEQSFQTGGGLPPSDTDTYTNTTNRMSRTGIQDPSLQITHPIFEGGDVHLSGMFRETFPVSNLSLSSHTWVQSYSSIINLKMRHRLGLTNILNLSYYSRDAYVVPFDTNFSTGLLTQLSHRTNSWFRASVGQKTQFDSHLYLPVGQTAELFTTADFMISPLVFVGPRVHFPIYSANAVGLETPATPATSNILIELFFQAAI